MGTILDIEDRVPGMCRLGTFFDIGGDTFTPSPIDENIERASPRLAPIEHLKTAHAPTVIPTRLRTHPGPSALLFSVHRYASEAISSAVGVAVTHALR